MPCPLHAARPRTVAALLLAVGLGCRSAQEYRVEADESVYALIEARRAAFVADPSGFRIDAPEGSLRGRLLAGGLELAPLTLVQCLEVAAENSRSYQDRRESLYLAALDLTLERFRFEVQERGALAAIFNGGGTEAETAELRSDLGLTRLFGSGARIIGDIGLSLFRFVSTGDAFEATSDLSLAFTRPLLRGSGRLVVMEPLTQAERDLVYEVRRYERFRRTFAFDVTDRVYRILQQRDTLENEQQNFERLKLLRERNEALAEAGQLSEIQADQARQDELRARNRVVVARQDLESLLDGFKLFLGLPIGAPFAIDPAELERLEQAGLVEVDLREDEVVVHALAHRLDHLTVQDRVDDAERATRIAADALRAGLGLAAVATSQSEGGQIFDHDIGDVDWTLSLSLDLPIERLPERNAYRAALIGLDAARRASEELADVIVASLRDALRNLAARGETYRIQTGAVELAERRVDSTTMSFEAGRAETRDLLEAQEALVQAQNAATRALVDYRLAALALYRDMEILGVDESGFTIEPISRSPNP